MKLLITGGSGFIGTHLIRSLLEGNKIERIVNVDQELSAISDSRLETLVFDIRSEIFVESIKVTGQFDCCIHLAALCKEPGYEWEEYFETNFSGTKNTISLCEKLEIERILFTSTMMVYKAGEIQRNEGSMTAPDTAYGISKLLAEKELSLWQKENVGRELKIIRPAVVFGPNENANFTRLYNSLKKGFFPFVGKSSTVKSNIYVKELVRFIEFLIVNQTKNEVYNFAFNESSEMSSILDTFNKVFEFNPFTPVLPYRLLLFLSYGFEVLNSLGVKNGIHHRRIEKLYNSTDIKPLNALNDGYEFKYDLESSLKDWEVSKTL